MSTLRAHALLAFTLLAAACGGGTTDGPGATAPPNTPKGDPTAPAASLTPSTPGTGSSTPTTPPPPPVPGGGGTAPIKASAMAADLQAIGLDPKALPALNKMKPDQLRQLMKTFTKATGMACTGCHDQNDFHASTPNKKVAAKMWDNWVRGMSFEDGSLLYCDSCHQGKAEFLDSHDKKALGKWMDDNFVSKLKRTDKKENGCATCHGESMDMHFLEKWKK